METLRTSTYSSHLTLNSNAINHINFYNSNNEIIHTAYDRLMTETDHEFAGELNILQVLNTGKSFRKEETKQAFINKMLQKHINFAYTDFSTKTLELFLYVDNEFIKVVKEEETTKMHPCSYDLTKTYTTTKTITLDIYNKIVKDKQTVESNTVQMPEVQEQAKKLYEELKDNYIFMQEHIFNELFNKYELVKREKPLLSD